MPDIEQPTEPSPQSLTPEVEIEIEEIRPEPTCPRCEYPADECTCTYCTVCDEYEEHGCECLLCNNCGMNFQEGYNSSCSACSYCSRCIERGAVEHYNCSGCNGCRSEDSRSCDGCGEHECCTSFSCREEDCYHCENCCTCKDTHGHIKSYSCREYPKAIPNPKTVSKDYLYLGVECETEAANEDTDLKDIADIIHDNHSSEILMKEDGSLENGIELVTGRYSLDAHKNLWPRLCTTAIGAGLRSWKHSSTGVHVHMSRSFFSQLDIGKILVFINSDNVFIRANIKKIAGRSANTYCKISKKKLQDVHLCANRYEAVNLTNDKTIELRIFKGTLNAQHILADIEFCHALAYWVKETSIQDIESWESFWKYVTKHRKLYSHLQTFLIPVQGTLPNVEASEPDHNEEPITEENGGE